MYKPKSKVPATIQITDIAGLVRGASEGQGLGNAFLSHIQAVDGIYHVVRAFEDPDVTHNEGDVDPLRDMDIINGELIAKDLQWLAGKKDDIEKIIKRTNAKPARDEMDVILKVEELLNNQKFVKDGDWKASEIEFLNSH